MRIVHSWLKEYLQENTPSVAETERLLLEHSFEVEEVTEIAGETVLDVDVLPNRAADCLCHRGVAREIAAVTSTALTHDPFATKPDLLPTDRITITVENDADCPHFDMALMTQVAVGPSPDWLQQRLRAMGQRPINNIVDATNYVMFSLGQPLHAYDADKFKADSEGRWRIGVRRAREGEEVTSLSGDTYTLTDQVQLIVNALDDTPAGLAGIKGGNYAAIDDSTTTILIEAGSFDPTLTRKASKLLKLQTDASKRFENGLSPAVVPYALSEIVKLLTEIAGGTLEGYAHHRAGDFANPAVRLRHRRTEQLLGTFIEVATIEHLLDDLGFTSTVIKEGEWEIVAPFERRDIGIEEDVIEEIGRVMGYDRIVSIVPDTVPLAAVNARHYYSEQIREVLIAQGFSEVVTSSFRKKDVVKLKNAVASDKGCLRSGLVKNLTDVLDRNSPLQDLLGTPDTRVFEIGTVFNVVDGVIEEHWAVGLGVRIRQNGYSGKEDKVLTEALTQLEKELDIALDHHMEKGVAEFDLSAALSKLPQPDSYEPRPVSPEVTFQPYSSYPSVSRDIALFVEAGTPAREVESVINEHAGVLRVRTTLFDEFTKEGRVSFAFRLVFQSFDKTLTDEEVNEIMESIYAAVTSRGWEVR